MIRLGVMDIGSQPPLLSHPKGLPARPQLFFLALDRHRATKAPISSISESHSLYDRVTGVMKINYPRSGCSHVMIVPGDGGDDDGGGDGGDLLDVGAGPYFLLMVSLCGTSLSQNVYGSF